MKNFFKSMKTFVRAMPHFLLFEFLYKIMLIALGCPLLALALKLTMAASGITYLSDESLLIYLKNPLTLLFLLLILFAVGFFAFVELSALATCFSCASKKEPVSVGGMLKTGLKSFAKAFRGLGILRFMRFLLFMPFAEFTLSSGTFIGPIMPVLRRIFQNFDNRIAVIVYLAIQSVVILLIVGRSYCLHYLVLTDKSFGDCSRKSLEKINNKRFRMGLQFLLWTLVILGITAAATFGISFIIVYIIKGFSLPGKAFRSALHVLVYAVKVFAAISAFFSAPAIMCWLTGKFMADLSEDEEITLPDCGKLIKEKKKNAALIAVITAVGIGLNISYFVGVYRGNIRVNARISGTQVTAHRGFSRTAPENTKYAFEAAIDCKADYIELDVQLTKDEQVVVIHDDTLGRTTNGSGRVDRYTYEELSELSAGGWFAAEYADAKIMLLSEVLELVDKDCMLNIEIKDIGNVDLTVDKTVELVKEYGITKSCYITSFSYKALQRVKAIEPKIKTGLIANLAASVRYSDLTDIDAVSLNHIFVNKSVVETAHQNGKLVFVWTVNRKTDIKHMLTLGVDNIITDRPDLALEIINSKKVGDTALIILEKIFAS